MMSVLLTSIVHATVLVAIVAVAARLTRRIAPTALNPATRYCLWWVVMAAVLALPAVHALWPAAAGLALRPASPIVTAAPTADGVASGVATFAVIVPDLLAAVMPWLVALAAGFVAWRVFALVRAAAFVRGARARCRPAPYEVERALSGWMHVRAAGRQARLLVSPDLPGPAVLGPVIGAGPGERDPIIALPAWAIERLDPASLDLIVLHEHAHVERGDDRDLLVQSAIEALFCWHPAVVWIGRRLDEERERACDDVVVARTGRAASYARCLVDVAARGVPTPGLRLASAAGHAGRRLSLRVERLLTTARPARAGLQPSWVSGGAVALTAMAALSVTAWPRLQVVESTGGQSVGVASVEKWDRMPTSSMVSSSHRAQPASRTPDVWDAPVAPTMAPSPVRRAGLQTPRRSPRSVAAQPEPLGDVADTTSEPAIAARDESAGAPMLASTTSNAPALLIFSLSPADAVQSVARSIQPADSSGDTRVLAGMPYTHRFMPTAGTRVASSRMYEDASPWKRTADAGESIGRGAAHAGVKTAGFFSRMGRAIASSF